ncbi:dimethylhistidine N-methyltransferase [Iodidimonas gelatinilytica]|uniref:Dimethylhistidine N-methyltransferase n=1 Tax=Iodidimonas gelatinilytica TaxID=1236966 RepID=A0A5A7MN72_9PROT|nr:L-histidine N(alpha)-methyltransferase [Iodidimonas gelatinilytica]GEQ96418.1 dimethylhistidine N-methyltransferase [Iodidimonas gelatinilytica]GER00252.1 dimethylhistidine N-methyltransferase [Iodidimonas gelatinilytica]
MPSTTTPLAAYIDLAPDLETFEHAALAGLKNTPKAVSAKFFYDERGSRLFEDICKQPEYYPTRTELAILEKNRSDIARHIGPEALVIEFGAGALEKVRLLLEALDRPAGFTAIDISGDHLHEAAQELATDFPDIPITAICADYTSLDALPGNANNNAGRKVGFFPGSTIGNFSPQDAQRFLSTVKSLVGHAGLLVIGVDLKKDKTVLDAAYNDAAGITAQFNLNLIRRINTELGGHFDENSFRHKAFYNADMSRVEMHLESLKDQTTDLAGHSISFKAGETIHTEISCKYSIADFQDLAKKAGWSPVTVYTDEQKLFSLHVLSAD